MQKSQLPKPKISIIIPIYNVVPYLSACLDSVIDQTYENLEIILINDGSTDESAKIAEDYAKKDSRIFYLHQTNSGVSAARNRGLQLATGEYLSFVDADDTISPNLIEYLYNNLQKHSVDLASITFKAKATLTKTLNTEEALKQLLLERNVTFHLWGKLYRRSLWEGIIFPTKHIYEDVATIAHIFAKCERIFVSHSPLYNYRCRSGSYVTTPSPSQFADLFHYAENNLDFIRKNYPTLIKYAEKYLFTITRRTIQDLFRAKATFSKADKKTYLKRIKQYAPAALSLKETSKSEKIIAALALLNKSLLLPLLSLQSRRSLTATYS